VIDDIPNIPQVKRSLLEQLVGQLSDITGMAAIVLGGSYASGPQPDSVIGLPSRSHDLLEHMHRHVEQAYAAMD